MDPLTCPKCQGHMRIIHFIEDEEAIKKILRHLGLWGGGRPQPNVKVPSVTIYLDDSEPQVLSPDSFYLHFGLPDGFLQDFKTAQNDFTGYDLCYIFAVSSHSKT